MLTGNKGEWSEIYVFLKLLSDGKLYAADENLKKDENSFFPILEIYRKEANKNLTFIRNQKDVEIIENNNKEKIPLSDFASNAQILFDDIVNNKGSFSNQSIENFLTRIGISSLKSSSANKKDIEMKVYDSNTGFTQILGFSIKSKLGGISTLFNSSQSTNFVYRINTTDELIASIDLINQIEKGSKIKNRILKIIELGGEFVFEGIESERFNLNLLMIDGDLPEIMAHFLLISYIEDLKSIKDIEEKMRARNPLRYNLEYGHPFYEYKIKKFLSDIALGMTPTSIWNGRPDASGGYIIVRPDGEILCYHLFNRAQFEDYLFKNTKLDTPSSIRNRFGLIYNENDNFYFKLNLQIRFTN